MCVFGACATTALLFEANEDWTGPGQRREFALRALADGPGIIVGDLPALIELVNDFAPEHLRLLTRDDRAVYEEVRNAGGVLAGPGTRFVFRLFAQ